MFERCTQLFSRIRTLFINVICIIQTNPEKNLIFAMILITCQHDSRSSTKKHIPKRVAD